MSENSCPRVKASCCPRIKRVEVDPTSAMHLHENPAKRRRGYESPPLLISESDASSADTAQPFPQLENCDELLVAPDDQCDLDEALKEAVRLDIIEGNDDLDAPADEWVDEDFEVFGKSATSRSPVNPVQHEVHLEDLQFKQVPHAVFRKASAVLTDKCLSSAASITAVQEEE